MAVLTKRLHPYRWSQSSDVRLLRVARLKDVKSIPAIPYLIREAFDHRFVKVEAAWKSRIVEVRRW